MCLFWTYIVAVWYRFCNDGSTQYLVFFAISLSGFFYRTLDKLSQKEDSRMLVIILRNSYVSLRKPKSKTIGKCSLSNKKSLWGVTLGITQKLHFEKYV